MYQINVVGPVHICVPGRTVELRDFAGSKPREVLCVLAVNAGRPVPKDVLAAALWGEDLPLSWRSTLEGYVSLLRRALQPGGRARDSVVLTRPGGYQLDGERVQVDLARFNDLVLQADKARDAEALPLLEAALALVRGDLLDDERSTVWAERVRAQHGKRVRRASIRAAELALTSSQLELAIRFADQVCESDPVCETAWRVAIEAHWRAGRRSEALRSVQELRGQLSSALGIEPGGATERLYVTILRDESNAVV